MATSKPVDAACLMNGEVTLASAFDDVRNVQSVEATWTEDAAAWRASVWTTGTPIFPTSGYQSPPALPESQIPERPATSTSGCAHASECGASVICAGVELLPPSM